MSAKILEKEAYLFEITSIRKNNSWGRSRSQWRAVYTPEITIPFYSNKNRKVNIDVYNGKIKVNSIEVEATKGYNESGFDVSFSKKGLKAYQKENKKIRKAANGIYYLPKGKYTVKIGEESSNFEIK
jgi:hypothetical protein